MALSLLTQQPSFLESETHLDSYLLQEKYAVKVKPDQMENNNNDHSRHLSQANNDSRYQLTSNQNFLSSNRSFSSGYHHQHMGPKYQQVINFVDSPPTSEESWSDEHSKGSPGPQIIDVQTIYSNSGSRKRRMDWDSLDIGQSENNSAVQTGTLLHKISPHEINKQKKEKNSGRNNWTDDIEFDLNSEFNHNSYLNNETFLSFAPTLTALKQEPHTDQFKVDKCPLNSYTAGSVSKIDKSTNGNESSYISVDKSKSVLNGNSIGCSSPQKSECYEHNSVTEKLNRESEENGFPGLFNVDKCNSQNSTGIQQSSVVDANTFQSATNETTLCSDDHRFQYILAAATSIATKNNEEALTYLNQAQSYEIKLKKIGDLSVYRDKIFKSVIKICFHERRLQFMEREQMQQWQTSRPGERIIEVDVPLSYGVYHVSQPLNPSYLNVVEVFWDPHKDVGVYIKVNCISTEFTPKKHGGEKGVPFRLQIETYIESKHTSTLSAAAAATTTTTTTTTTSSSSSSTTTAAVVAAATSPTTTQSKVNPGTPENLTSINSNNSVSKSTLPLICKQPVHAAACQIKVFKLKGADRKHKQDREKLQKRTQSEQDKFQPSYENTIMNDVSLDLVMSTDGCFSPEGLKIWPNSPVQIPKYAGVFPIVSQAASTTPVGNNTVTSTNSPTLKAMDTNMVSPHHLAVEDESALNIAPDSTPIQVTQWLTYHRLTSYLATFAKFSGSDILRMSKDDLIQICGLADGIRMFNIIRAKAIIPRLTFYISMDGNSFNAIYLCSNTSKELTQKLFKLPGFYEMIANGSSIGSFDNCGQLSNGWSMQSKHSSSSSSILNDVSKCFVYISGPAGVHVAVTDEVINNEIKDGSLFALDLENGKIILKLITKSD